MKFNRYEVIMESGKEYDVYATGYEEARILAQAKAIKNAEPFGVKEVWEISYRK